MIIATDSIHGGTGNGYNARIPQCTGDEKMIAKTYDEIFHNTKVKQYPQGFCKITTASRKIFKEDGWEMRKDPNREFVSKPQDKNAVTRADSRRRSKTKVEDIICMNADDFKYFVTLTISPDKVDSKDPKAILPLLHSFLNNMRSRHGLKYLLIPEYHKSGAIHFHGLFNDSITVIDSFTRKAKGYSKPLKIETLKRKGVNIDDCQVVYNLPQWKHGFSTACEIYGDVNGVSAYVTKYITKDLSKIFGNFYFAGGNIVRNVPQYLTDTDYGTADFDREINIPEARLSLKYLRTG